MITAFEDYVNSFPSWYGAMTIFVGFGCGISAVYGFTDGGRFGSGYYRVKTRKSLLGVILCLAMLWPIPLAIFLIRLPFRWNKSEIDEVMGYERKAYSKRGLDYDEEMRKKDQERWEVEEAERHARWEEECEWEREEEERENLRRLALDAEARFGERYFGGM